jgi:hypothetical protein
MTNLQKHLVTQFPLRISKFKAILETRNSEEVIGYACRSTICPIARILKKECGGWDTYVHKEVTSFGGHKYENPEWVREFVHQIDGCKQTNDPITVEEALEIVNNFYICTVCNQYNPEGTNCGKKDNCPW